MPEWECGKTAGMITTTDDMKGRPQSWTAQWTDPNNSLLTLFGYGETEGDALTALAWEAEALKKRLELVLCTLDIAAQRGL